MREVFRVLRCAALALALLVPAAGFAQTPSPGGFAFVSTGRCSVESLRVRVGASVSTLQIGFTDELCLCENDEASTREWLERLVQMTTGQPYLEDPNQARDLLRSAIPGSTPAVNLRVAGDSEEDSVTMFCYTEQQVLDYYRAFHEARAFAEIVPEG